jgi:rare lipoprotein A (peptidoglycan hydrolase)
MHERTGARLGSVSRLQLFALVTIASVMFLNTAFHLGLTTTPNSNKPSTITESPSPDKPAARVVARAELQNTKPKRVTAYARVQPRDASPPLDEATGESAPSPKKKNSMTAEALPLPHPAPQQGSARLTFNAPPLPVRAPKQARPAISRSDAPPLPPKEVRSRLAGSGLHQTGRASWYTLDSLTASGEKMDDVALTAAHNSLPFGTKVLIENIANGRSVAVRINDRGPFVAGRIVDLSKAAAETLEMIADGVADVRLSVIYDTVASAD